MVVLLWWNSKWTLTLYVHRVLRGSDTGANSGRPLGVTPGKIRQWGGRTGRVVPQIATWAWQRFSHVSRESGAISLQRSPADKQNSQALAPCSVLSSQDCLRAAWPLRESKVGPKQVKAGICQPRHSLKWRASSFLKGPCPGAPHSCPARRHMINWLVFHAVTNKT